MFFSKLDFLSSPPQMYFLNKRTNKTIFGGILFIIYIILIMDIFIFYTLNFYYNDKYDIRYSLYKNFTENMEENNKIEELNPVLNFTIDLKKISSNLEVSDLSDQLMIIDNNHSVIKRNSIISRSPTNMDMMIVHICLDTCSLEKNEQTDLTYILNISYSGYKIDHQNYKIPLEKNSDKFPFYKELFFTLSKSTFFQINWGVIKYKEERGILGLFDNLFNKKNKFTSIDIDSIEQTNTEGAIVLEERNFPKIKYKILSIIRMRSDHTQYIEYTRIKKSFLDVLANIGALFSTIFMVFNFIFSFYSRNFNNYKIVKEILSVPKFEILNTNIKLPRSKTIKFECINKKNKNILNNDNQSFNTSKSVPFKSKGINLANKIKIKNGANYDVNNYNYNFFKINFIHFLLNNVYFKKKNRRKEQEIIDICNSIVSKYISIDTVLFNQIIFENLMKDYKWNDYNLKNIGNNSLIKKLRLII